MSQTIQIIDRIAPIILLLFIGKWIQTSKLVAEQSIADIKKIVINFALPAVLFNSFLEVDLQLSYLWFLPVIFGYCLLLYFFGVILHQRLDIQGQYFPFLTTGFEYGMIGVSLFGAAYGLDKIGKFAVVDFGQEMFIWFLYTALLVQKRDGASDTSKLLKMFVSSPVIIAIFAGILLNLIGLPELLDSIPFIGGLLATIDLGGSITVPLILIVVGYGIRIDMKEFFYSARLIAIRLMVNIPAALLLNRVFIEGILGLDKGFKAALFTLLILPPPFILTLYMKPELKEELHSVDNTLTLHTIITILIFIIYFALNPTI